MIGKKSGVATRLQTIFPNLLVWHCSNHRLELAVNDCVNEVSGINHFKIFIDKLYSLYHLSPKNQNELKKAAASVEAQILRIGRILSVRWVASSKRTINAVLHNYQALCEHFETASKDLTRDTKERAKYNGLLNIMSDVQFKKNLHVMSDALDEMGDLSEVLQRQNITLVEADKAIRTTIRIFDSMTTQPGPKLDKLLCSISENTYKGIQLHEGRVVPINTAQLYTSLANNMRNRMITTSSSHGSRYDAKRQTSQIENENTYTNLLASISVLEPKNWPKSNDGEVEIQYGDKEIRHLCTQFYLNDVQIIRGFRFYKMSGGKEDIPDDLKPLLNVIASIPISTSECERNFSSMNEIVTPLRSSLSVETTTALLFINCVGPPLTQFNPEKYVRSWLAKSRHSADDAASRKRVYKLDKKYELLWKLL
nr:E3 SUMO-protein ligase KIAA1586-like [Onthophagus taurus]